MALNPRLRARLEREKEQEKRLTREQKEDLAGLLPEGQVLLDEPTAQHSVMLAGGPIEAFVVVNDVDELKLVLEWSATHAVEYRYWGCGALTLVRDGGLSGIIIKLGDAFKGASVDRIVDDDVFVTMGAGTSFGELLSLCETEGIAGLEKFAAAQGTVAGLLCSVNTPEGLSLEDMIEEVTMLTRDMKELSLRGSGLRFEEGRLKIPRTAAVTKLLMKLKRSTKEDVVRLVEEARNLSDHSDVPNFAFAFSSSSKTSAEIFIDETGLKGVRVGHARVSSNNACTIINEGEATARDVAVLINLVKDRVKQASGEVIESTIEVIGER